MKQLLRLTWQEREREREYKSMCVSVGYIVRLNCQFVLIGLIIFLSSYLFTMKDDNHTFIFSERDDRLNNVFFLRSSPLCDHVLFVIAVLSPYPASHKYCSLLQHSISACDGLKIWILFSSASITNIN